jgi:hypothetical protein
MVTHHPLDPLAANGLPLGTKLGMDTRCAIPFPVTSMNPLDIAQQHTVSALARLSGRDRQA